MADRLKVANTAIKLWQGAPGSLQRVSDSANSVYSFMKSGEKRYLRLTSGCDRTKDQIEAELDFISYLQQGGVSAMPAIASTAGRFIEEFSDISDPLFACAFNQAKGKRFRYDSTRHNREHFRLRGRVLGRIHALSKDYVPASNFRRAAWDDDKLLIDVDDFLPKSEGIVWRQYDALRERLRDFPKSSQTYGLIHGDFGETNYRYCDDRLNIFDFDDSFYHWFACDVAITIYPHGWRKEGSQLLEWLLEGYSESMRLNMTLADVTMFCDWRQLYMFLVYARKWGFERLSKQQADWFAEKRRTITRGYTWNV